MLQYLIRAQKIGLEREKAYSLVDAALATGRLGEAEKVLEDYLKLHPADIEFLHRHAEVCYRLGKLERAIDSLERVLLFEPQRAEALELKRMIHTTHLEKNGLKI